MIVCFYEPSVQPGEPYFISLVFPREYKAINPEMLGKYSDFLKVLSLRGLLAHSSWVTNTHNVSKTTPQKNKIPGDP